METCRSVRVDRKGIAAVQRGWRISGSVASQKCQRRRYFDVIETDRQTVSLQVLTNLMSNAAKFPNPRRSSKFLLYSEVLRNPIFDGLTAGLETIQLCYESPRLLFPSRPPASLRLCVAVGQREDHGAFARRAMRSCWLDDGKCLPRDFGFSVSGRDTIRGWA